MFFSPSEHSNGGNAFYFDEDKKRPSDAFLVQDSDVQKAINLPEGATYDFSAPSGGSKYGVLSTTPAPAPTDAEKLAAAQSAKKAEILAAFNTAQAADVTDSNGIVWNGGEVSGNKIFLACQLAQQAGATSVDLWDKANTKHSLSIADGMKVAAALGAAYQSAFAHKQDLKAQIASATTVADVDAISW